MLWTGTSLPAARTSGSLRRSENDWADIAVETQSLQAVVLAVNEAAAAAEKHLAAVALEEAGGGCEHAGGAGARVVELPPQLGSAAPAQGSAGLRFPQKLQPSCQSGARASQPRKACQPNIGCGGWVRVQGAGSGCGCLGGVRPASVFPCLRGGPGLGWCGSRRRDPVAVDAGRQAAPAAGHQATLWTWRAAARTFAPRSCSSFALALSPGGAKAAAPSLPIALGAL